MRRTVPAKSPLSAAVVALAMLYAIGRTSDASVAVALTHKCGTLSQNVTWPAAGGPYILDCQVVVPAGVTLTIEPGTVVKAQANFGGLYIQGRLRNDPGGARIYFTSSRDTDPEVGGDTDEADTTPPAGGNWYGILFDSTSAGNELNNVEVRYAGGYGANIVSDTPGLTIADSTLRSASNAAAQLTGRASMGVRVVNTDAFGNNINGLYVPAGSLPSGANPSSGTWLRSSLPYVLGGQVHVPLMLTLTIEPGTVVKGMAGRGALYVQGTLRNDPGGDRIYFTSSRDADADVGGDTDDADAQPAAAGDWYGIFFESDSTGNELHNVEVRYGGGYGGNVVSDTPELTIFDSTIKYASNAAVFLTGRASMGAGTVNTNAFGNRINGLYMPGGALTSGTNPSSGTWWRSSLPYVLGGQVIVPQTLTLTIEPGTVVKAQAGAGGLYVQGTLRNDPGDRIYFTSSRDADVEVGGDTDDADAQDPAPGDWYGISFASSSAWNSLNNVEVRYGGGYGANIVSDTPGLWIADSTLRDASNAAVYLTGPASMGAGVVNTGAFGNHINGLYVLGGALASGASPSSGTWRRSSLPYVLGGQVSVPQTLTLTIEPGTVVKAQAGAGGLYVQGTLKNDPGGDRIYFTSSRDTDLEVGGDADDADTTPPAGLDWYGIYFESTSAGNELNNVEVRYAGGYGGNIVLNTSGVTIRNSTIFHSNAAGIQVSGAGVSPTIAGVQFILNDTGISFSNGSGGSVTQSSFVGHRFGVAIDASSLPILGVAANDADPARRGFNSFGCNGAHVCGSNAAIVEARNNWWGSAPPDTALFCSPATVDFADYLTQETVPPGSSRLPVLARLMVTRQSGVDLRIDWENIAPVCRYDVFRGSTPTGLSLISGPGGVDGTTFTDAAAAASGTPNFYYAVSVH